MSKKEQPAIEEIKKQVLQTFNSKNEISNISKGDKGTYVNEVLKKWDMNEKILKLFEDNIEKDQELKEKYAVILIVMLGIELIALLVIFILRGCKILEYTDSTFNIFISGGIAEIFVLVKVIVEYLFKDNLTNALNIILENNNHIKNKSSKKNNKPTDKP